MIKEVRLSKKAEKEILFVPEFIKVKLMTWIDAVEETGLEEVRKIRGYHDEALRGKFSGFRSIRLNRSYRAVYIIEDQVAEFVLIERINKHEY